MHSGAPAESRADPDQDRYRVVSILATDTLFRHTVDRHVRSVRGRGATLRAARPSFRQRYPQTSLSCQRDGGIGESGLSRGFAYRDGRAELIAPKASWWDDRGLARVIVDTSGPPIGPNAACRRLLDSPPGSAGAITLRDLVSSELYQELSLESKRRQAGEAWSDPCLCVSRQVGAWTSSSTCCPTAPGSASRWHCAALPIATAPTTGRHSGGPHRVHAGRAPDAALSERHPPRARIRRAVAESLTDDACVVLVTAAIMRLDVAMDGYEPTLAYGYSAGRRPDPRTSPDSGEQRATDHPSGQNRSTEDRRAAGTEDRRPCSDLLRWSEGGEFRTHPAPGRR